MDTEEQEWQRHLRRMESITERLLLAGWIRRAVADSNGGAIEYTGKGIERMNHLFDALRDLDPHTMRDDDVHGLLFLLTMRDRQPPGSG